MFAGALWEIMRDWHRRCSYWCFFCVCVWSDIIPTQPGILSRTLRDPISGFLGQESSSFGSIFVKHFVGYTAEFSIILSEHFVG